MNVALMVLLFLVLLVMGVPIAYSIGCVAVVGILGLGSVPLITVVQRMFSGLNSFTLLAVPLFILAANLMNRGKISDRLIDFSLKLVGHIRGGLAHANVVVSMIFAGISGSSQADTAGIGKILIPRMIKEGYDKETAVGVTAASSTIGVIIPPSITMVVYASVATTSVGALFMGGIIPGVLVGLAQMGIISIFAKKFNYPKYKRATIKEILMSFLVNLPALLTPGVIIGGVCFGWFTPTEAACVACFYAAILGFFVFRTLKLKDLFDLFVDTITLTSVSLFALATAQALGQLLSYCNASTVFAQLINSVVTSRLTFMAMAIAMYMFLGTFMDAIPAMILFVPVMLPVAQFYGISPIHFGIVTVMTLSIGQVTPPYGLCLLLAGKIGKIPVGRSFKGVLPYMLAELVVVMIVAFLPEICFYIPKLINPEWFAWV